MLVSFMTFCTGAAIWVRSERNVRSPFWHNIRDKPRVSCLHHCYLTCIINCLLTAQLGAFANRQKANDSHFGSFWVVDNQQFSMLQGYNQPLQPVNLISASRYYFIVHTSSTLFSFLCFCSGEKGQEVFLQWKVKKRCWNLFRAKSDHAPRKQKNSYR